MLPHWLSIRNDELNLYIRPDSFIVRRFKGLRGVKPKCVDQDRIFLTKSQSHREIDTAYLASSLQALFQLERWRAATITVVLSNQFVRYAVIPWNADISGDEERQSYLNHHFLTVYGEAMANWNKCVSPSRYGQNVLASAVPNQLIQTIEDIVSTQPITLRTVQPYLMDIANQAREEIKAQKLNRACWLAVIADHRVCLSLIVDDQWSLIKTVQQQCDVMTQIEQLIQRERLVNSVVDSVLKEVRGLPMLVHWPDKSKTEKLELDPHLLIRLDLSKLFANELDASQITRLMTS